MTYNHAKVDLSLVPDGILKNTFIHFAEQHNALVDGANEMKQDLDQISGDTPEAKAEMHRLLAYVRQMAHYLHSRRFNLMLASAQAYLLCGILKQCGIRTQPFGLLIEQIINTVIQILQKIS
jgi:superoxide dismutase